MVNEDELMELIDQIRFNLPDEIKQANWTVSEQQRIMTAVIEIKESDPAKHLAVTPKGEDRLRIFPQGLNQARFRGIDPRNLPFCDRSQLGELVESRWSRGDCSGAS